MVIRDAIRMGKESLPYVETADLDIRLFLCRIMNIEKIQLITGMDRELSGEQLSAFMQMVERRKSGEPSQYILGHCEFMGLDFTVTPAVLIPRPDTETLVELAIGRISGGRVLDIGTGSGCVAISIAHYCRAAEVTAVDISADAIKLAEENAKRNGVSVRFVNKDIFSGVEGMYDAVVSNPPYIESDVIPTLQTEVLREPVSALDGGADGLRFYREIIKNMPEHLTANGFIAFEVGHTQAEAVRDLFLKNGNYNNIEIFKDLAGIQRVVSAYRN